VFGLSTGSEPGRHGSARALALPAGLAAAGAVLAALIALPGLVIERRLFFAEAKHAVTLYYGADAV
jgi:DMSO reductase anchor subunit